LLDTLEKIARAPFREKKHMKFTEATTENPEENPNPIMSVKNKLELVT
jgi:hypothetical protein